MIKNYSFKKTEVGMIPIEWETKQLEEVSIKIFTGRDPKGGKTGHSKKLTSYRLIRSGNVYDGFLDIENTAFISDNIRKEIKSAEVFENDVLLNQLGDGKTFARSCVVPKEVLPAYITRSVGCIRVNENLILPYYLNAFLILNKIKKYIEAFNSGSSRRAIDGGKMKQFVIPIAQMPEQKIIADFNRISTDLIRVNHNISICLEKIALLIFQRWFVNFEFPDDDGNPYRSNQGKMIKTPRGKIPDNWKCTTVGNIANIIMGQSPPGSSYNEQENGLPFYQGIRDFGFRYPIKRVFCTDPKRIVDAGTILLSVRAPIGIINIAKEKCIIGRGISGLVSKEGYDNFLYYFLKTKDYYWRIYENEGTVFGAIKKTDIDKIPIIKPEEKIIKKFNKVINILDEYIFKNEKKNTVLTELHNVLLPSLLSGIIRVSAETN